MGCLTGLSSCCSAVFKCCPEECCPEIKTECALCSCCDYNSNIVAEKHDTHYCEGCCSGFVGCCVVINDVGDKIKEAENQLKTAPRNEISISRGEDRVPLLAEINRIAQKVFPDQKDASDEVMKNRYDNIYKPLVGAYDVDIEKLGEHTRNNVFTLFHLIRGDNLKRTALAQEKPKEWKKVLQLELYIFAEDLPWSFSDEKSKTVYNNSPSAVRLQGVSESTAQILIENREKIARARLISELDREVIFALLRVAIANSSDKEGGNPLYPLWEESFKAEDVSKTIRKIKSERKEAIRAKQSNRAGLRILHQAGAALIPPNYRKTAQKQKNETGIFSCFTSCCCFTVTPDKQIKKVQRQLTTLPVAEPEPSASKSSHAPVSLLEETDLIAKALFPRDEESKQKTIEKHRFRTVYGPFAYGEVGTTQKLSKRKEKTRQENLGKNIRQNVFSLFLACKKENLSIAGLGKRFPDKISKGIQLKLATKDGDVYLNIGSTQRARLLIENISKIAEANLLSDIDDRRVILALLWAAKANSSDKDANNALRFLWKKLKADDVSRAGTRIEEPNEEDKKMARISSAHSPPLSPASPEAIKLITEKEEKKQTPDME